MFEITPEKENSFNRKAFCDYIASQNDCTGFTMELLNSIIDYAHRYEHVSKDQFAYYISDLIPSIDFKTVCGFCRDEILTKDGKAAKHEFWSENK